MQKILFIALAIACFYANQGLSFNPSFKNQNLSLQNPDYSCGDDNCGCGSGDNKK